MEFMPPASGKQKRIELAAKYALHHGANLGILDSVRALLERHARSADAANRRDGPGVRHFINVKQLDRPYFFTAAMASSDPYGSPPPEPKSDEPSAMSSISSIPIFLTRAPFLVQPRRTRQGTLRHMPLTFRRPGHP